MIKYKCPHCKGEIEEVVKVTSNEKGITEKPKRIIWPVKNQDGSINWKHMFRVDIQSVLFTVAIIILLIGFYQINQQCYDFVSDPCQFASKTGQCKVDMTNGSLELGIYEFNKPIQIGNTTQ